MAFLELMGKYFMDIKLIIYLTFENRDIISRAYAMSPRMVISDYCSNRHEADLVLPGSAPIIIDSDKAWVVDA